MNGETSLCYSDILGLEKFTIFCGAGISKNSGLPLANELKQSILETLPIGNQDMYEVINSNLPFEAFMGSLSENTDISKILDIFKNGEPNTNHILIARLAKNGYLRTIFTTNLDLLIEKALEKEGLKEGIDFERYYNEGHFSEMNLDHLNDKIKIFKIHGSADNNDSVRATLKAVASKTLSDKRMNVIKYLFSKGRHKKVLILGYSCSDAFDITPQILSIAVERKEIIFVEHANEEKIEIEDIKTKEYKNPFKTFLGKRIKCDTDKFIKGLWDSIEEIIGVYKPIKCKTEWKGYLDDWIKELKDNKGALSKYFIIGVVLHHISASKRAIEYYKRSLAIAKEIGDKAEELKCYSNLGAAYGCLGNLETAIEYHKKALEIAKEIGDKAKESECYINLGVDYGGLRDLKWDIEYQTQALEIAKEIGDKLIEVRCYMNLGVCYGQLGDIERAIKYQKQSLEIAKEIGDKVLEVGCYGNLGTAYYNLGDLETAIEYHKKALEIAKEIGDRSVESVGDINLGVDYYSLGDFNGAIEYYLKAEKILEETEDIQSSIVVYKFLSLAYEKIGDNENAEKYKKKLEQI